MKLIFLLMDIVMDLIELTQVELDEVNGAFLHGAALGAGAYLLGSAFNGCF